VEPVRRRAARYRVHLQVRYEAAADFVREYAENLSRGGLFIRRARGLARHRDVMVELELPGFGSYQVRAEVVHVITPEMAAEHGRAAGAGLAIREAPDGFEEALSNYLVRLGRRADSLLLAADEPLGRLLVAAGYQVAPVASPETLGEALAAQRGGEARLVGVVVPSAEIEAYRLAAGDAADLVIAMDEPRQIDEVLVALDAGL
jgi:Tfp pilus assembly protein PilZ